MRGVMNPTEKALWFVESHLPAKISLDDVAASSGVSRFHVTRAFGAATGRSVMGYMRARRLSEAARKLAGGARDILSVALDAGYGSHEAFTRAFRDQFGTTPERVRERGNTGGIPIVAPFELRPLREAPIAGPRICEGAAFRIVGLSDSFSWGNAIKIPAQWQRFM